MVIPPTLYTTAMELIIWQCAQILVTSQVKIYKRTNTTLTMPGRRLQVELERSVSAVHLVSAGRQAGQGGRDHRLSISLVCHSAEKHITKLSASHNIKVSLCKQYIRT